MTEHGPRIGLGMLGLDVHTKGIRTLSRRLRDFGFEVIYLGEHLTASQMAASAVAEDVDLIGVSFSSAAYLDHCRGLLLELDRAGAADIPVVVGGLIHADDHEVLEGMGIAGIFGPGSATADIAADLRSISDRHVGGREGRMT